MIKRYRHWKGGIYDLIGEGRIQSETALFDMDEIAIYRALADNSIWGRRQSEFYDGRFTAIAEFEEPKDPPSVMVILDLTRRLTKLVEINDMDAATVYSDMISSLEMLYPESSKIIKERYGV